MTCVTNLVVALSFVAGALHAQTPVGGQALGAAVRTPVTNLQSGQVTLPSGGGFVSADVDALSAPEVRVDALTTMTSGAMDTQASTAQSTAHLENVNVLNGLITAETVIAATSSWVSGAAGWNAEGSSFTNLVVNGVPLGSGDYLPLYGGEAVLVDGVTAGRVRSAAYGHTVERNVAYAYLPAELGAGARVEVEVLGTPSAAELAADVLVDPQNLRVLG